MITLSQGMTYALAAALVALSARSALVPHAAASAYGVPLPDAIEPTPYLEVKANRDLVLAGLLVVAAAANHVVLSSALLVGAIAPIADAWTVKRHGKRSATAIHLGTAVYLIGASAIARSGH